MLNRNLKHDIIILSLFILCKIWHSKPSPYLFTTMSSITTVNLNNFHFKQIFILISIKPSMWWKSFSERMWHLRWQHSQWNRTCPYCSALLLTAKSNSFCCQNGMAIMLCSVLQPLEHPKVFSPFKMAFGISQSQGEHIIVFLMSQVLNIHCIGTFTMVKNVILKL